MSRVANRTFIKVNNGGTGVEAVHLFRRFLLDTGRPVERSLRGRLSLRRYSWVTGDSEVVIWISNDKRASVDRLKSLNTCRLLVTDLPDPYVCRLSVRVPATPINRSICDTHYRNTDVSSAWRLDHSLRLRAFCRSEHWRQLLENILPCGFGARAGDGHHCFSVDNNGHGLSQPRAVRCSFWHK